MRRYNALVRATLEEADLDDLDTRRRIAGRHEKELIKKVLEQYTSGRIDQDKAGRVLRRVATEPTKNKPLNVVADFVEILNRSTEAGQALNTNAIRKLGQSLQIIPGALDQLGRQEQTLALQLIERAYRLQAAH